MNSEISIFNYKDLFYSAANPETYIHLKSKIFTSHAKSKRANLQKEKVFYVASQEQRCRFIQKARFLQQKQRANVKIHTQRKFFFTQQAKSNCVISLKDKISTTQAKSKIHEKRKFSTQYPASQNQPKYPQSKSRETTHIYSKSKCFMKLFKFSDHCRTKVSMIDEFNTNLNCKSLRIL